ncbi:hypothetical protein [Aneurinibacillus tyrosinisolvens]|uniref:hypothetical protein n=1 Tax=Aneurinibacillus tyrosinisolvens TaxID=1443435 RepID=UPI00063EDB56|nr:hypothetical protein [Aneurinibacillus tyrosinisolvens]
MSLKDLEDFLNDDSEGKDTFNYEEDKQKWLQSVKGLYQDITAWLKPLTEKPNSNIDISFEKTVLNEEHIGDYEIDKMYIDIKGQRVVLEPIGTWIIGSRGRIDMVGTYGKVLFTYVDERLTKPKVTVRVFSSAAEMAFEQEMKKEIEAAVKTPVVYTWKIMTPAPNVQYIPLNEETFSKALLSVITNG